LGGLVFFDVDTQRDFMDKGGALYVKGAEGIRPNLKELTGLARRNGIRVFGDVDSHYGTEEFREIEKDELAVWGGPFPLHCVKGTPGWERIPETKPKNPLFVPSRPMAEAELESARKHAGDVVFEKHAVDVATNPNFAKLMQGVGEAVVYGVATDYCVRLVSLRMRELGISVTVVSDAIKAIDEEAGRKAVEEMGKAGVKFAATNEMLARFGERKKIGLH
jgi:nicotinamidase/pyrazinamidase